MRRASLFAAVLALACAGSRAGDAPLGRDEARSFVDALERSITAKDWDTLGGAFLPTAFVLYQEATQARPTRMAPRRWIASLAEVAEGTDFTRRRELTSVELDDAGRAIVRSRIRETVLGEDGVIEVVTEEMLTLARRGGRTGILGLALFVGDLRVEDVEWL